MPMLQPDNFPQCTLFMWLPIREPAATLRLCAKASHQGCVAVLDLEDSIGPVRDSVSLRILARENLAGLGVLCSNKINADVALRINAFGTQDFYSDIECLRQISGISWKALFIPKVSNCHDILAVKAILDSNHLRYHSLIPIIETVKGIENLDSICRCVSACSQYIQYGHFDYCLDADIWPFMAMTSGDFWQFITPIIRIIESQKMHFINSPYTRLHNTTGFFSIIRRLNRICRSSFGQALITFQQSQSLYTTENSSDVQSGMDPNESPRITALKVIEKYEKLHMDDRSFVIDDGEGRFIPPHEYFAAKRFLNRSTHRIHEFA